MPLCGYLCEYVGWESVFYVTGALGLAWSLAWSLLVYNGPEQHPRISAEEKELLRVMLYPCVSIMGHESIYR